MAGIFSRTKVLFSGPVSITVSKAIAIAALVGFTGLEPVALAVTESDIEFNIESDIIEPPANMPSWFFERRIIGDNNLEKIEAAKSSKYYAMTRPIAILKDSSDQGFCTGWRVAEDLFVTNFHCWEFAACNVVFELDYETDRASDKHAKFRCEAALAQNELYDYAIYKVKRVSDESRKTKSRLEMLADEGGVITMWGGEISVGQPLIVAGHPQGRTKEIDRSKDCLVSTIEPEEMGGRMTIRHTCDTEGGSSGSPVLDRKTGFAVGLHWGGEDSYNMSIPMNLVLDDMEKNVDAATFKKLTIAGRK